MADAAAGDPGRRGRTCRGGWWQAVSGEPWGRPLPGIAPAALPIWDRESDAAWRPLPKRTRRRYRLSRAGLEALRANAQRVRPWTQSTGPTTPAGIDASRRNALKGRTRSALWRERDRALAEMFRAWRVSDKALDELAKLARRWRVSMDEALAWTERPGFDGRGPMPVAPIVRIVWSDGTEV